MLNKGIYLSTDDILVKVWGYESDAESGAVWVYISYVRKRLAAIGADIETEPSAVLAILLQRSGMLTDGKTVAEKVYHIRYAGGNNSACRAYRRNKRFQLSHHQWR